MFIFLDFNMPPAKKRPRRMAPSLPNDPSIPMSKGLSPFSNLREDEMHYIFRRFTNGVKAGMNLEVVCQKFRSQIIKRTCWSNNDDKLKLFLNCNSALNDGKFTLKQLPTALSVLLDRVTVRDICISGYRFSRLDMLSICDVINNHKDSFALECINVEFALDRLQLLISSLTSCGLSNVRKIIADCESETVEPYLNLVCPLLLNCPNLRSLSIGIDEDERDVSYK